MAESSSPHQHTLEGEAFQKALERYCDESKPDQLILKQIQGWGMEWKATTKEIPELSFQPTDVLQGTLTWKSDYMVAEVECFCCWEPHHDSNEKKQQKQVGTISFVLRSKLRFRSKHESKSGEKPSKEEKRAQEKIRTRMISRLKEDSYIKRLLPETNSKKKESEEALVLCEARISVSNSSSEEGKLEERVDVVDNVAEGLRRALFSQAESSLDVIEVLLSLPLLPGSIHDIHVPCPLADRAKLRLLEDAMFDACEREGEAELIEDIKISPTADNNDNSEGGGKQKHDKAQPNNNRSNKRTKR